MAFDWLKRFQKEIVKAPDYAEKTLAQYRLGMRAQGSIRGVRIAIGRQGCPASQAIQPQTVYHPDDAPHLPLPACSQPERCQCVYRPVMSYELDEAGQWRGEA